MQIHVILETCLARKAFFHARDIRTLSATSRILVIDPSSGMVSISCMADSYITRKPVAITIRPTANAPYGPPGESGRD